MWALGISCYYHDSAACLLEDGKVVAAAQEERFSRKKHDQGFPFQAVRYCLAETGLASVDLDAVAFYDKPLLKFQRILETAFAVVPRGLATFLEAMPVWSREKLWIEGSIREALEDCGARVPEQIHFPEHHASHAASAFYPSPFEEAAILTIDGVGEWATATIGIGEGSSVRLLEQLNFPHSLGLLYSAFTYFTGFRVNSAEYKLMGLAPYGEGKYTDRIRTELMDLKEDGSFRLNMDYFAYLDDLVMTSERFDRLFDGPPREPESPITRREMDLAKSVQEVTEEVVLRMARHAHAVTGKDALCMAGGVALNCVANGLLVRKGPFKKLWIQPAADDAGGALGAAFAVCHQVLDQPRVVDGQQDAMNGSLLGPQFSNEQIREYLDANDFVYRELSDEEWGPTLAALIAEEKVLGLFQGRMEFGPRALGCRSIIGDPRSERMQSVINRKIKFRESFRPFAPAVLESRASEYFDIDCPSPYMMLVAPLREERCRAVSDSARELGVGERVNQVRSDLPAITHVDYSARVQTVTADSNPRFHKLLAAFAERTGCAVLINTSFNVRGEPIVCTPEDALLCFMKTEMDCLAVEGFLLLKDEQHQQMKTRDWGEAFGLD